MSLYRRKALFFILFDNTANMKSGCDISALSGSRCQDRNGSFETFFGGKPLEGRGERAPGVSWESV